MAMNPRLLRPKASGVTAPVFTTQGYARAWGVTTKSTGNVTGTAETDTGYYAVKWWDNTTTVYDSGDPFSKAAAGNQRAFEIYPSDSTGDPSGQFDGFDISNNALTRVRSEDVTLADGVAGYYNYFNYTFVPGSPAESAILSGNLLSASALDEFYTDLDSGGGDIFVSGNPGIVADTPTIATAKGYTVFGSVPPGTALLLNFNGTFTDSSPNDLTVTVSGSAEISTTQSKFGGASLYADISSNNRSGAQVTPFDMGSAWTVEAWVRANSDSSYLRTVFARRDGFNNGMSLGIGQNDEPFFYNGLLGGVSGSGTVPLGEWVHMAWSMTEGGTLRMFVNGVSAYEGQVSYSINPDFATVGYAPFSDAAYQESFKGYIDDLRVVVRTALYVANFTPPVAQLGVYP